MLLRIYPDNPAPRHIRQVVEQLRAGGVVIYPTDTVYGLGCDLFSKKAIERVCQLKHINPRDFQYTILCQDVAQALEYTRQVSNTTFKILKRVLPGPYTFILPAGKKLPHFSVSPRKTIGIRVVDNGIVTEMVRQLGNPLITTSLKHEDDILEYRTDPELIHERFGKQVDLVIHGGYGGNVPSTIVDLSDEEHPVLLREGLGDPNKLDIDWEDGTA
ncbi:MAG: threonylcarbamoyl-AMP synthase [Bacteroidetes bacterium]|jgi:tRNA threonylcarbamoyl adenosine modification protein (Sua5/YciO/YrdC/YwlC family)|nr:threonylcarbamoyl-AMP synthase [Bacteroidota bacterium]